MSSGKKYACMLLKAYDALPTFFSVFARRTPWRRMRSDTTARSSLLHTPNATRNVNT